MRIRLMGSRTKRRRPLHASPDQRVRVVIADQDALARSMMRAALDDACGVAPIASTGDGREALELVRHYRLTILLLDTGLLSNGRVGLVEAILVSSPETRVVSVSVDDDRTALATFRAGAAGHLSKDIDPRELGSLVVRVAAGEAIIPRRLMRPLLELLRQLPETGWRPLHSVLTNRGWQIVELLGGPRRRTTSPSVGCSRRRRSRPYQEAATQTVRASRPDAVRAARRLRREEALRGKATPWLPGRSSRGHPHNRHVSARRETAAAKFSASRAGVPQQQGAIGR
jgi:DNA-binding NarL/FixJ family response regulator